VAESRATLLGSFKSTDNLAWLGDVIQDLLDTVKRQAEEIKRLRSLLDQTSENSHRPPSSDPPSAPRRKRRKKSKRKPGGQPGHEGKSRRPVPPDRVDETKDIRPDQCEHCHEPLFFGFDPQPVRHQVWDIPPIRPTVTEYRLHVLSCPRCGTRTRAKLPDEVSGAFGPGVHACVSLFSGAYRMSVRNIRQLLGDVFALEISDGSITNLKTKISPALAKPVEEIGSAIRTATFVNIDETSWRVKGKKAWLWAVVTDFAARFRIDPSRGGRVARELLGTDPPIVGSDRYSGYQWIPVEKRQICLAHLLRDFKAMKGPDEDDPLGVELETELESLFHEWHRGQRGEIQRSTLIRRGKSIHRRIRGLLLDGLAHPEYAGKCEKILEVEPALTTFLTNDRVSPTNNRAERVLRHAVIWRKTSFGTESDGGSRFVERILSAVETLRIQGESVLDYLARAARAAIAGQPAPSLLPNMAAAVHHAA